MTSARLEHVYGVPYKQVDGAPLTVDLHWTGRSEENPVLLWLHGGGWALGDSRLGEEKILWPYAESGFTVVSVNYRLTGAAGHPAALHDVFDALSWVGSGAERARFDSRRILIGGGSAGGHLAALASVNKASYARRHPDAVFWPRGTVALYPVLNPLAYDAEKLARGVPEPGTFAAESHARSGGRIPRFGLDLVGAGEIPEPSPFLDSYRSLNADDVPPHLILHGANDSDVPVRHGIALYELLIAQNVDATLLLFGDADHGSPRFHRGPALAAVAAFAAERAPVRTD